MLPPTPDVPLPTVMEMAPALPPVAVPEPTLSDPELPPLDVPDENDIVPDPPAAPALADLMVRAPLDEAVPSPLDMNMTPPVLTVLRPAWATTWPPTPLVPLPTVTATLPPVPPVAEPDPMPSGPELPPFDVPEENDIAPDPPAAPEFADLMTRAPDEVAVPSPLDMNITPPVCTVERPE